jgi:hypothetical protein
VHHLQDIHEESNPAPQAAHDVSHARVMAFGHCSVRCTQGLGAFELVLLRVGAG